MATHEAKVLGVPAEIFAIDFRVIDCDVLRLPEGILRVEHSIVDFHIVTILEGIVTILMISIDTDIRGVHEEIVGILNATVLYAHMLTIPQGFLSIREYAITEVDVLHATEHFRSLDAAIAHRDATAVPERGTGTLGKETVRDTETAALPEDILALEEAPLGLNIVSFLDGRLAEMDSDILQT